MSGRLILAATPIGNSADASLQLLDLLANADIVAAEDTRRALALASRLEVKIGGRLISLFEHNEAANAPKILDEVSEGAVAVVITDAGMPSISDPGFRITNLAIERGIEVEVAPGPSAALAALLLSGFPTDRFCFEGFLSPKPGKKVHQLEALAAEERTMIFFCSTHKVARDLAAMASVFGDERPVCLAREITKTFQEVLRLPLGELAELAASKTFKGEIVVVVRGC